MQPDELNLMHHSTVRRWTWLPVLVLTLLQAVQTCAQHVDRQTSETSTVRVRIEVTIPDAAEATGDEPADVFLAGDHELLGRWRPDGLRLNRGANDVYFAEFSAPDTTLIQFKVTRGSWQTVEKNTVGRDIANRQFEVKEPKDGEPQRISVKVERWGAAATAKPSVTGTLELHKDVASEYLTQTRNVSVWLPPAMLNRTAGMRSFICTMGRISSTTRPLHLASNGRSMKQQHD